PDPPSRHRVEMKDPVGLAVANAAQDDRLGLVVAGHRQTVARHPDGSTWSSAGCVLAVPVDGQAGHPPVPNLEDVRRLRGDLLDWDPAAPATSLVLEEHEHTVIAELPDLAGNRLQVCPVPEHP